MPRWRLIYLAFLGLTLLSHCNGTSGLALTWSQLEANCSTADVGTTNITASNNVIVLSGQISADPCATVTSNLTVEGSIISINFVSTVEQTTICIECLGAIYFNGTISGLKPGNYTVQIVHQDSVVTSQNIDL